MAYVGKPDLPKYDYEDQLTFGVCVGEGIAHQLEYEALDAFPGQQIRFAELFIYRGAKVIEGNWNEGTNPALAYQALLKQGVCLEQYYPFNTLTDVHNIPEPNKAAYDNALNYRIKSVTQLDSTVEAIDKALNSGKVVNVGTIVTDNFVQAPEEGFIGLPEGSIVGGHDYVIIGHDDEMTHTFPSGKTLTGYYRIVNSWNRQQYAWVAKDFIAFHMDYGAPILEGAWIVDTGWGTPKPAPVPTPAPTPTPTPTPITTYKTVIELYIGRQSAYVNGHEIILDQAPVIENNTTMVPLRFICENDSFEVLWDENLQKVTLRK